MTLRNFSLGAAVTATLGLFAQSAVSEELSVATFLPPQHHTNTGMFTWFAEEIDKRSGGSLTMKLYPAGQLGAGPVQQYKRAVEGVGDITFGVSAYTPALFPKTMLAILPGTSENADQSTRAIWSVFEEHLADEYEDVKVLAVGTVTGNLRQDCAFRGHDNTHHRSAWGGSSANAGDRDVHRPIHRHDRRDDGLV